MFSTDNVSQMHALLTETLDCCPLCKDTKIDLYDRVDFRGIELSYVMCGNCGLVFQSPRIPEIDLNPFYADEYRTFYLGQSEPREQEIIVQQRRAEHLVDFLQQADPQFKPKYHLDIGCGSGALLMETQKRFGSRVVGVEPDDAHRAFVTSSGIVALSTLGEWLSASDFARPDLISLSHVLEHINEPIAYLHTLLERVMTSESRLLIEVPNLYVHPSFEVAHPFAFSLTTLNNLLSVSGLTVIQHRLHSVPRKRHTISPLYITVLTRPDPSASSNSIRPDRFSRHYRKIGRMLLISESISRRGFRYLRTRLKRVIQTSLLHQRP